MHQIMIAPAGERCGHVGRVAGEAFSCLLHAGHAGPHASEPSPGETVAWPREGEREPTPIGLYGLKYDTPEEVRQQRTEEALEQNREARRDAVELAVKALTPLAGAYRSTEEYGAEIVELARRLKTYIYNGSSS